MIHSTRTASYARYSSDMQSDASITDQLRNVRTHCAHMQWTTPPATRAWSDEAISGSRNDRPGYLAMMAAAEARAFDVLIVDDVDRLGRDDLEKRRAAKFLIHWGIRIVGVSDGVDSTRDDFKLVFGMRSMIGEMYVDDLAKKTHRGLMGKALNGFSAGGLSYGYRVVPGALGPDGLPTNNKRAIDEAQAKIVREIYTRYAGGESPRAIAHDLNRRRVAAPRSKAKSWAFGSIHGDLRRGIGILANSVYIGRVIWNRSDWVKNPVSGRRLRRERPEAEWVVKEMPELRIVSADLWAAVQARLRRYAGATGAARQERGPNARTGGPRPRYMLSGLLRCSECSRPMQIVTQNRYGCPGHRDRGPTVCGFNFYIHRERAEAAILGTVRDKWMSDRAYKAVEAAAREMLTTRSDERAARAGVAAAVQKRDNIMRAIEAGIVTTTTKAALLAAEAAVAAAGDALATAQEASPTTLLPRLRERFRGLAGKLADDGDISRVRQALGDLFEEGIPVVIREGRPVAVLEGSAVTQVAGAGFECYRTTANVPLD